MTRPSNVVADGPGPHILLVQCSSMSNDNSNNNLLECAFADYPPMTWSPVDRYIHPWLCPGTCRKSCSPVVHWQFYFYGALSTNKWCLSTIRDDKFDPVAVTPIHHHHRHHARLPVSHSSVCRLGLVVAEKFLIILIVNWYDDTATCVGSSTQNYIKQEGLIGSGDGSVHGKFDNLVVRVCAIRNLLFVVQL